ncbi:hypothetical protein [Rahnella woolbedingensis]|uniref:hypothetical protein n=1 Tax=Rahnella woolbedingensis TaxID=1510574 RepID=UPI00142E1FB8|nr:hypothetical protein [Rahnella woolbedingensis]
MTNKEEFLAYLKEASEQVNKWPTWKKSGLSDTGSARSSSPSVVQGRSSAKSGKTRLA